MTASAATNQSVLKIPRILILDAVVALNSTLPATLQVPPDLDFEWWWTSIFCTAASGMKILMQESTQRPFILSSSPQAPQAFNGILANNWAGLASNNAAFPLAVPYVMPANRAYQFQLTDSSGSQNTVQIALHGFGLLPVNT
jgi:hypothetical protein